MRWLTLFAAAAVTLTSQIASAQTAAPNAAGVSMGHIHLYVPDPAAELKAFVDVMGGTEVKSGSLNMVKLPNVFVIATQATPTPGAQVIHHVGFMVKSFAVTKAKVEKAGLMFRELTPGEQGFVTFPGDVTVEIQQDPTITTEVAFHHIHLNSLNQAADRDWYAKTFGGADGTRRNAPVALIPGGEVDFILAGGAGRGGKGKDAPPAPAPAPIAGSKGHALDHIGFEVTDLKAFTDKLAASGQKMDMQVTDMTKTIGLKIAFITDPNGVSIELTEGLSKIK